MANIDNDLKRKAESGDEVAMVKLAVQYIQEQELGKAMELCDRLDQTQKPTAKFICVNMRASCALICEQKKYFKSACTHWIYVEETAEILLEAQKAGKISSFDEEEVEQLASYLDDTTYFIARDWYLEAALILDEDEKNRNVLLRKVLAKAKGQKSPRFQVLCGVCHILLSDHKRAYDLLKFLEDDHTYAASLNETWEEEVFRAGLMGLALIVQYGTAGQKADSMRACILLQANLPYIKREESRADIEKYINEHFGKVENLTVSEQKVKHVSSSNIPAGNPNAYSHERMKQAVDLCMRRQALKKIIYEGNASLNATYVSNEKYVQDQQGSLINEFIQDFIIRLLISWLLFALIIGIIMGIVASIGGDPNSIIFNLFLLFPIFHIGRILLVRYLDRKTIESSNELHDYAIRRDWRDAHREEIKQLVDSTSEELRELESYMEDRTVCIIPKMYWDVGGMLWNYIDNSRADNLKEAINLHERLEHEKEISNMVSNIYAVARDTQSLAEHASFEAEMARMSSESAESHVRNAEFWSMMNYYGR